MASAAGARIVDMVWEDLTPVGILTREAFEDAVATVLALGGSTNAVIHLIAMAGRCGVPLTLDDFDQMSRRVPVLANIRPGGAYLMEDFYYAGVLRGAGPAGGPGMPEYGMLPIPGYLLARGVRDMVRVSDARMSGTSYGACVLHVAPESHVGGPLAFVRSGDPVRLDVPSRTLSLDIPERELARRRARWRPPAARFGRGYGALYSEHVTQAHQGCDFGFLARRGDYPEPDPQ